jgi:hypothetical protein
MERDPYEKSLLKILKELKNKMFLSEGDRRAIRAYENALNIYREFKWTT